MKAKRSLRQLRRRHFIVRREVSRKNVYRKLFAESLEDRRFLCTVASGVISGPDPVVWVDTSQPYCLNNGDLFIDAGATLIIKSDVEVNNPSNNN